MYFNSMIFELQELTLYFKSVSHILKSLFFTATCKTEHKVFEFLGIFCLQVEKFVDRLSISSVNFTSFLKTAS